MTDGHEALHHAVCATFGTEVIKVPSVILLSFKGILLSLPFTLEPIPILPLQLVRSSVRQLEVGGGRH